MEEYRWERRLTRGSALLYVLGLVLTLNLFGFMGTTAFAHSSVQGATQQKLAPANTAVLTFHNDQFRSGHNPNETILNTNTVNSKVFGKRVSYPVDGQVYAQPLFVPNVSTGGTLHNVVYVATENDSVYAFDADQSSTVAPLWHTSFINPPAVTPVLSQDVYLKYANKDINPQIGTTGTPVIDLHSGTLFVVALTRENKTYVQRLHALDITSGQDKPGSPVVIKATLRGKGYDNTNGTINFRPDRGNQRAALLLYNGIVYITWAAFGDTDPYHGWVIGYNATTYKQVGTAVYNSTPDGQEGGIWLGGSGPAVDANGNMFFTSGNGDFNLNRGGRNAGDSFIKLSTQNGLKQVDYFSPSNQTCLDGRDADLGSGGALILPDQAHTSHPHILIGIGKEGRVYVLDRDNMGKYTADPHLQCNTNEEKRIDIDKVVQELAPGTTGSLFGAMGYWSGDASHGQYIYVGGYNDALRAISVNKGRLANVPSSRSPETFGFSGATPSISSNGTAPGSAIVWVNSPSSCAFPGCAPSGPGALRAYDATNLGRELYNSEQSPVRDRVDSYVKFTTPTVANGKVFVGTSGSLSIYGLLGGYNSIGVSDDSNTAKGDFDYAGNSYSAQALNSAGLAPGKSFIFSGVSFPWPNVAPGHLNNYDAAGQTIAVTPVNNARTLAFLGAAANGAASGTATIAYTDGSKQNFTVGFTDWATRSTSFNNQFVATLPYRNTPGGRQALTTYLFYTDVVLQAGKTVQNVTLPSTINGGQMHIFAVATKDTLPIPSLPAYNNAGTSDNGNVNAANFDGIGSSYSAQGLQAAGIVPGQKVVYNNAAFTWPAPGSGSPNNYQVNGQAYPISPVSNATALAFLGSSTNGNANGTGTIIYTDGSTQTFTLGLSDWTLGGKAGSPAYNNGIVAQMPYRNSRARAGQENVTTYLFYTDVALQAGKTVQNVTLPSTTNQGQLHVFAVGTK